MLQKKSSNGEKTSLPKHWFLSRILCFVVALGIWIYVVNITTQDFEKTFNLINISVDGLEADVVRLLVDGLIDGKIVIEDGKVVSLAGLKKDADKRGCKVQVLINAILEQLSE